MANIILHHYEFSTFSEKVRIALGIKQATWQSVDIPGLPPRPLLSPLTGGYRRAPVMQIGADIYCDTHVILAALDRLFPQKPLVNTPHEGLARAIGFAWEREMWIPSIGVLVHYIGEHIPPEFLKDRKESYLGVDISKDAMAPQFAAHTQFVRAQIAWLARALIGRQFLFGDHVSAADLACWQTIFLLRKNCPPEVDTLLGLAPLNDWYQRILAFGHGTSSPLSPEDAFEIAKTSTPQAISHLPANGDPDGLNDGTMVTVTPEDNAKVPVTGQLLATDAFEIVIRHRDAQAGDLNVHFPRLGYTVQATA